MKIRDPAATLAALYGLEKVLNGSDTYSWVESIEFRSDYLQKCKECRP